MKKCRKAIYPKAIVALILSIMLVFASVPSLFAVEAELEAAPNYGAANILSNSTLSERSPNETVLSAEDTTLNSSSDESRGLECSISNLTLSEIASTILSDELEVSISATQAASQSISPFIDLVPPCPIPLRHVYKYAEGTIFPAPLGGTSFSFGVTALNPPSDFELYMASQISWPPTANSMKIMDSIMSENIVENIDGKIKDADELPAEGIFTFSVTQGQNTNHLPDYLNIIYSPAEYELRVYVAEYEWGYLEECEWKFVTRAIVDVAAVVIVPDSPNPNAPGVGAEVDELVFTNILEVDEDLYNPVCDVCRQPSWASCICPASTYHEPCESCNEYPCACDKSTPTTPTPSPGPKTGDDANQSAYLTIMIAALAVMGVSVYILGSPKGFARRKQI